MTDGLGRSLGDRIGMVGYGDGYVMVAVRIFRWRKNGEVRGKG